MLVCRCEDISVYRVSNGEVTYICEGCYRIINQKEFNRKKTLKRALGIFKKPS